jgi:hypothetical protein
MRIFSAYSLHRHAVFVGSASFRSSGVDDYDAFGCAVECGFPVTARAVGGAGDRCRLGVVDQNAVAAIVRVTDGDSSGIACCRLSASSALSKRVPRPGPSRG